MSDTRPPAHDGSRGETYVRRRARRFAERFAWADVKALEISNALNACYNSQRAALGRAYEDLGFPRALGRSSLLHTLYLAEKPMTHGEISGELEVTQGTVTFLVDGLEKEGLVTRTVDSEDRRVVFVELTPKGEEVCARITPAVAELANRIFSVMSDEEKDLMIELLLRVLDSSQQELETRRSTRLAAETVD